MEHSLQISRRMLAILLAALIVAVAFGMAMLIWLLLDGSDDGEILLPDDAYQDPDINMEPYPGDPNAPSLQPPADGGAASFICEAEMQIDLAQERVGLMFANPAASLRNAVIELHIQGVTVAQSGRIDPGYRITEMMLRRGEMLTQGIYHGELRIYFYDPATGAQVVRTSFPVNVTVK